MVNLLAIVFCYLESVLVIMYDKLFIFNILNSTIKVKVMIIWFIQVRVYFIEIKTAELVTIWYHVLLLCVTCERTVL